MYIQSRKRREKWRKGEKKRETFEGTYLTANDSIYQNPRYLRETKSSLTRRKNEGRANNVQFTLRFEAAVFLSGIRNIENSTILPYPRFERNASKLINPAGIKGS